MAGRRRRPKGMVRSEGEDEAVIILSSSDDEEANRDLSIEIIERARQREAKRKRLEDSKAGAVPFSFIDLSSASSDDVDAVPDPSGGAPAPLAEGEPSNKKSKKKKKRKKASVEDNRAAPQEDIVNEEEPLGMADSIVTEVNETLDNAELRNLLAPKEDPVKEEELLGTANSIFTEVNETSDNVVLRKLLRVPRYFDPPGDRIVETCHNCGEEGHRAVSCRMERRQRPCFVCGMFGHFANQCTQGQDCFICKRRGHIAKDCPNKDKQFAQDSKICLRCGGIGHAMSSCRNNYAPDDLKEIQCYICKKYGHLCCTNLTFPAPQEVSCYNCAQPGHTGLGCAKQAGETSTAASPSLCYKCGEEGHFARGCSRTSKPKQWNGEISTPRRFPKKNRDSLGFKSAPHDLGKPHKKKNQQFEDRRNTTAGKSRARGGWSVEDPGDLPNTKYKAKGWKSPKTPVKWSPKFHSKNSPGHFPGSSQSPWKKHISPFRTPSVHASTSAYNHNMHASSSAYQHGYSDSRYDNSRGWRQWRA